MTETYKEKVSCLHYQQLGPIAPCYPCLIASHAIFPSVYEMN